MIVRAPRSGRARPRRRKRHSTPGLPDVLPDARRRSPGTFVALTVAASTLFWLLGEGQIAGQLGVDLPVSSLMACCPAVAAIVLVRRREPPGGVRRLLARALDHHRMPGSGWYVPAVALMPAVMAASYGVRRLAGAAVPEPDVSAGVVVASCVLFLVAAAAEEIGWTGYATGPLQARWGALTAGVVLGAVWALWHVVPYAQAGHGAGWIVGQCLFTVAFRVILGWLYVRTGGSVLAATLCHASGNVGWVLLPYDPAVAAAVAWAVAVVLTAADRARMLPPRPPGDGG